MIGYLARRLLAMLPTLLGITLITFFVISIAPGDPVQASFGTGGAGAEEEGGGDQDRLADAIKAKKQLLGMMAEDYAVLAWGTGRAGEELVPLSHERAAPLPEWARALVSSGDVLYAAGDDGSVHALEVATGRGTSFAAHDESIWALAVDGDRIATADKKGTIRVWSADGTRQAEVEGDGKPVRALVFAGGSLYAGSDSGGIRVIDPSSGTVSGRIDLHNGAVYALATLGDRLYSGGVDRTLRTIDLRSRTELGTALVHGGAVNDIAITPDGTVLATAADDRAVRLFTLADGLPEGERVLEGHYKMATAVAFSADGSVLFSGSRDELVRTWDVATGAPLGLAGETTGRIYDLATSPDGVFGAGTFWYKVPLWKRYLKWLGRIVTLDFGRSFVDDERVIDKIARALPITLGLNILAILIIYGVSIPLGIYAAVRRGQFFDNASSLVLFILYSVPNFWLATMLIMFLSSARYLNIFPSGKLHGPDPWDMSFLPWLGDLTWHLVLPLIVMVYAGFASLSRYVRTSMLEALSQDFVRTARAKGLAERIVVVRHAFRNALVTIVTLVGNLLPRLIGGSVIVEYIFSIDGMGKLGFDAILSRDYPVIMAITTFAALLTLIGILVSDLLYGVVDPRVRVNQ